MPNSEDLRYALARIDGRGYKAYKDLRGHYAFDRFDLFIDHAQGDPFATPSRIRARVSHSVADLPDDLYNSTHRRIAMQDFLAREVRAAIARIARGHRGTGKSGLFRIDAGGQEIIERTAIVVTPDWVEARMEIGLPASGRRVLARQAEEMLFGELPQIVERSLVWRNLPQAGARAFVDCAENQEHIRNQLDGLGLVAFVADGAILPRATGASDCPLAPDKSVHFRSPESLRVTMALANPSSGSITGMGVPNGVTLIVGGGYHGKSTLLRAIERGVYAHIPGDGREYVVTSRDVVKTRAEDGRRVERVDISPFIGNLPQNRSTSEFSSDDASGSTSQAANIIEAVEVGATGLLLDEDSSATNFMVRDARMQALVHKEHEPITPFLDRVREFHDTLGVSTVMVMGGCGDYFDVADTVIMMRDYLPFDVTADAKKIAREHATRRRVETVAPLSTNAGRVPLADSFDASRGRRDVKIDAKALDLILFGSDSIDLRGVEQLVDISQTRAIGHAIHLAAGRYMNGQATLREVVTALDDLFDRDGLDALDPFGRDGEHPGSFARPRRYEIAAAINRLRTVRMRQST